MEQKQRVIVYIDGFNFYFGLKSNAKWKKYYWLDIVKLFEMFMRPNQELVAVKYFSAKPDDIDQSLRQNAFFQANRENPKFKLILGKYLKKSITCFKCGNVIHTHEEKETDVRIATQIVADAYQKNCDISIVVSADSDMIPAIELATEACQKVFVYFPPYQYSSNLATMGMGKPIHMKLVSNNVFYLMWYILERQTLIYRYLRNGRLFSQSESEIRVIKRKIRNTVWNIQSYYGFFFSSMIFLFVLQEVWQFDKQEQCCQKC